MSWDKVVKVVVVGDSGVGKTCLMRGLCGQTFMENHVATIGVDFTTRILNTDEL